MEIHRLKKYFVISSGILSSLGLTRKQYRKAVDDVTLTFRRGKVLVLVGESGSGKTTLARLMLRAVEPDSGSIIFDGHDITNKSEKELKYFRKKVQMIHQDPYTSLNPLMTILDIVKEPLDIFCKHYSNKERIEIVLKTLADVFLDPVIETSAKYPYMLSGGQRQRVALARALVLLPELIIADEPVSMLDVSIRSEILHLMKKLSIEREITYLYITHDLATSRYIGDEIAVMYAGKIVEMGPAEGVLSKPLHPYTQALIQAVSEPDLSNLSAERIMPIKSENNAIPAKGCKFYNQCFYSMDICKVDPRQKEVEVKHWVSCYLYDKENLSK
ncbi:MAG TPA: oligopeptide/dipeptide ABC transporter ATP-binding protein [Nitrososphaeraceae archaeon]|nr:oligopeptide/dipeptide ABC transporter ATP-binding protein [Nitrososphaeraceae archaeon]